MKRFFYACAAILCIILSYHFGATNAQGQAGSSTSGISTGLLGQQPVMYVMTANGDVFARDLGGGPFEPVFASQVYSMGNFWGGATPAVRQSFGQLKARYR